MIVFDLCCPQEHVFEAWFGSTEDYAAQRARGLVACPICGDGAVEKAVMAPNVAPKGNRALVMANAPDGQAVSGAVQAARAMPAEMKAALATLAQAQANALKNSEHVGPRFAEEARAIHLGDAPERVIHGQATPAEARSLIEDGVPVAPLPLPIVPPERLQ